METNKERSSSDNESSDVSVDSEVNKKLQDLKSILAKTDTPLLNESGMPVANSSKEILSQLFRVLKADSSSVIMAETKGSEEQTVTSKKSKKSKKKHKHKEKKHKKHKNNKSEPDAEKNDHDDSLSHKRKHKHSSTNSDAKRKRVSDNTKSLSTNLHISSKDESTSTKQAPIEVTPDVQLVELISLDDDKGIESTLSSKEIETPIHSPSSLTQNSKHCEAEETPIPESSFKDPENVSSIVKEDLILDLEEEPDIQQSVFFSEMCPTLVGGTSGKPGAGKIVIKSLKFTSVFNGAVQDGETECVLKIQDVAELNLEKGDEKILKDKTPHELGNTIKLGESCEEGEISDSSTAVSKHSTTNSKGDSPEAKQENKVEDNVSLDEKKDKRKRRHSRKNSEEEDKNSRHRKHHSHDEGRRSASKSKDQKAKRRGKSKSRKSGSDHRERDKERKKDQSKETVRESRIKRSRSKDRHIRTKAKRSRSRDSHYKRPKDSSRDNSKDGRSHKRARSHTKSPGRIDKHKLLEIARKNAMSLLKQGAIPTSVATPEKVVAIKAGGKTVAELTDFCKQLSKKEALAEGTSDSEHDEFHHSSDSDLERPFHHPFQIKERPCSIVMNIRNAVQLPVKTLQEKTAEQSKQLRIQFPVSSGQQHRKTETEWVPVSPKKEAIAETSGPTSGPLVVLPAPSTTPAIPKVETVVFDTPSTEGLDIGSIVSQRLTAMRKLQENPYDSQALSEMYKAQKNMQTWAESKQLPGQFTGSTGVKFLTPAELSSGNQAWAKKDQLKVAQPVSGGMGMTLLQKMGWRPGEGLGKDKKGALIPLQLEVKTDKKGLVSQEELGRQVQIAPTNKKSLAGKHPVSLLVEYCSKRRWGIPQFEMCFECGPDHHKNFVFKVVVNNIEYKPSVASPNKKQAKAEAATTCLQTLGVLPL